MNACCFILGPFKNATSHLEYVCALIPALSPFLQKTVYTCKFFLKGGNITQACYFTNTRYYLILHVKDITIPNYIWKRKTQRPFKFMFHNHEKAGLCV